MKMIPSCIASDDYVDIPIYDTYEYFRFKWCEGESTEIAFTNAGIVGAQCSLDTDRDTDCLPNCFVYEVDCEKTQRQFYLITFDPVEEFDDILHSVCIPRNKFNLFKFFKEYMPTLEAVPYEFS